MDLYPSSDRYLSGSDAQSSLVKATSPAEIDFSRCAPSDCVDDVTDVALSDCGRSNFCWEPQDRDAVLQGELSKLFGERIWIQPRRTRIAGVRCWCI